IECDNPDNTKTIKSLDEPLPTVRAGSAQRGRTDQFILTPAPPRKGKIIGHKGSDINHRLRSLDEPAGTVPAPQQGQHHHQFIIEPDADMTGKATGEEFDKMGKPGTQSEKYFQLVRPALDDSCPTITAAGGNAGLASVCHPTERRKFSIAELRR